MYIYTIRADATYVSVPALMRQVADAGRAGQSGYNIAHADVVERLLIRTAIATEEEVITHHVNPYNILHAVPTYFVNGDLVQGTRIDNTGYFDDDTQANSHVVEPAVLRAGRVDPPATWPATPPTTMRAP